MFSTLSHYSYGPPLLYLLSRRCWYRLLKVIITVCGLVSRSFEALVVRLIYGCWMWTCILKVWYTLFSISFWDFLWSPPRLLWNGCLCVSILDVSCNVFDTFVLLSLYFLSFTTVFFWVVGFKDMGDFGGKFSLPLNSGRSLFIFKFFEQRSSGQNVLYNLL